MERRRKLLLGLATAGGAPCSRAGVLSLAVGRAPRAAASDRTSRGAPGQLCGEAYAGRFLRQLVRTLRARGFWSDTLSGARSFIRRFSWAFANVRDAEGRVGSNYHLPGLPTSFALDASGRIRAELRGLAGRALAEARAGRAA